MVPKQIKVGTYLYRVVRPSKKDMPNDLGECANDTLEIKVVSRQRLDKVREVLLHEVLHACHYNAGRSDTDTLTAEQWVEATTHTLLQVIQDNPQLLKFLAKANDPVHASSDLVRQT